LNVYLLPYTRLNTLGKDLVHEKHGLSYHQRQIRRKNSQTGHTPKELPINLWFREEKGKKISPWQFVIFLSECIVSSFPEKAPEVSLVLLLPLII